MEDSAAKDRWFEFAASVPRSDIVYTEEETDIASFRKRAHALYLKYVMVGSEFEVNIPSKMRKELKALMGDEAQWINEDEMTPLDLAIVFDGVMNEMKKLLKYSRVRFKEDEE